MLSPLTSFLLKGPLSFIQEKDWKKRIIKNANFILNLLLSLLDVLVIFIIIFKLILLMGGVFNKSDKTKQEVEADIVKINKIVNNELFFKKTLRTLHFELDYNFFNKIFSSKIITCQLVSKKRINFIHLHLD
jgi:hypothetical protein